MRISTRTLAQRWENILMLAMLTAIAIAAPLIFRQQVVTGTIVNAALITGVVLLGRKQALLVGILPSSIALATGILPSALAPMVPFIIAGNCILVLSVSLVSQRTYWGAAILGSVLKFAFLFAASFIVVDLVANQQLAMAVSRTLGWIQLATALAGSVLAFGILKVVKRDWLSF